jgi:hypothetical protein
LSLSGILARLHLSQRRPDRNLLVNRRNKLRNHATGRRRHLGVDLVSGHLDDRIPLVDEVANGHVPLENDALGHRLAHLGHGDLDRRLWHFDHPVYETVPTSSAVEIL